MGGDALRRRISIRDTRPESGVMKNNAGFRKVNRKPDRQREPSLNKKRAEEHVLQKDMPPQPAGEGKWKLELSSKWSDIYWGREESGDYFRNLLEKPPHQKHLAPKKTDPEKRECGKGNFPIKNRDPERKRDSKRPLSALKKAWGPRRIISRVGIGERQRFSRMGRG